MCYKKSPDFDIKKALGIFEKRAQTFTKFHNSIILENIMREESLTNLSPGEYAVIFSNINEDYQKTYFKV